MATLVLFEATTKPETAGPMRALLKEVLPQTRAYDGCRGVTAYANLDDGRTFVLVEHWDARGQYEKYLAWRTETGVVARLVSLLEGPPNIRYFEAVDA